MKRLKAKVKNDILKLRRINYILDRAGDNADIDMLGLVNAVNALDANEVKRVCKKDNQELEDKTVVELEVIAKKLRVKYYGKFNKHELIREIRYAQSHERNRC